MGRARECSRGQRYREGLTEVLVGLEAGVLVEAADDKVVGEPRRVVVLRGARHRRRPRAPVHSPELAAGPPRRPALLLSGPHSVYVYHHTALSLCVFFILSLGQGAKEAARTATTKPHCARARAHSTVRLCQSYLSISRADAPIFPPLSLRWPAPREKESTSNGDIIATAQARLIRCPADDTALRARCISPSVMRAMNAYARDCGRSLAAALCTTVCGRA